MSVMSNYSTQLVIAALVALTLCCDSPAEPAKRTVALATVHPLATDAGVDAYREGGNAVDAAVTAALTLGVVDAYNSGIGGSCFILIRRPDGGLVAIDGRDAAPAAATADLYQRDGEPDTSLSQLGPLAVATPGSLAAYAQAVRDCGALPLGRLLQPGYRLARDGFKIDAKLARALATKRGSLARFPGSRAALLNPDGSAPKTGDRLEQSDLARTYRGIAEHGPAYFYEGPIATRIGKWMEENGGVLTAEDFASYKAIPREPVVSAYRGNTIVGFPPPSSGGVHVAQILNILETFNVRDAFRESQPRGVNLVANAMKLAFADRAFWLGDSDYAQVPRGLVDKQYAEQLAQRITPDQATEVTQHGEPPRWRQDLFGRHTTHIAAADSEGYWVAITATINTTFGSKVIVPGTGVILNNQMDDFAIHPSAPNAFGLIGGQRNAVAGGKRPLSSMSPTIVLDSAGEPIMTLGGAGGPKIITQVLCTLVNVLDRELDPEAALAQPRYHHQWFPNVLGVESSMPEASVQQLKSMGHDVQRLPSTGVVQVVARTADGALTAHHDPHVEGKAITTTEQPVQKDKARRPTAQAAP